MRRWLSPVRRAQTPGQQARQLGVVALVLGLVLGGLGLQALDRDADLRDLAGLTTSEATVVDVDSKRRRADVYEVTFDAGGQPATARIPYAGPGRVGDTLPVAYVPADPSRARTVDGWSPGYRRLLLGAAVLVPLGLVLSALGAISRRRQGRFEGVGELEAAPEDPGLGQRVVRSRPAVLLLSAAPLLIVGPALLALMARSDRSSALATGLVLLVLLGFVGLPVLLYQQHGRDGVWHTPDELVAQRRSDVRRWRWEQVRELGIVLHRGRAAMAAARVDDGLDDGIGEDEWVTLARPLLGPVSSHDFARRLQALAEERGVAFDESVHGLDLADTGLARFARRGLGSWPRR